MKEIYPRQCDETKSLWKFRNKWQGKRIRYSIITELRLCEKDNTKQETREGIIVAVGEIQYRLRRETGSLIVEYESGKEDIVWPAPSTNLEII